MFIINSALSLIPKKKFIHFSVNDEIVFFLITVLIVHMSVFLLFFLF